MIEARISDAVETALGARPLVVTRLPGGRNNIVARVVLPERTVIAKLYFRHPGDSRDRLGTEFGVLGFLWDNGLRTIPRPIASDVAAGVGIYECVEGTPVDPGGVGPSEVRQLADLLVALWKLRSRPGADSLPHASEASLSLRACVDGLAARLGRLEQTLTGPDVDAARHLVRDVLRPAFERISRATANAAVRSGLDLDAGLAPDRRTISPADHGFHNALSGAAGLVFLDFEYAGWDDPAQMLANACLQPQIPMPVALRAGFLADTIARLHADRADARTLAQRVRVLYPLLALRWSLIMLNEFLPVDGLRRAFAGAPTVGRPQGQLDGARLQADEALAHAETRSFLDELVESA